jgi:hypothetical protein
MLVVVRFRELERSATRIAAVPSAAARSPAKL